VKNVCFYAPRERIVKNIFVVATYYTKFAAGYKQSFIYLLHYVSLRNIEKNSVTEAHQFYAAPAPAPGKTFDAAPAPAPTLLYSKAKFLK
jgi:hypothetical protein